MCRRSLLWNHQTPTLRRHKTTCLYHLPESRHIRLRCYINTEWMTYTETLSGNGVITNATRCSVSTTQMHTLPELPKLLKLLSTHFICAYLRKSPSSPTTRQILEKISPELIQQLDDVKSRVMASPCNLDVDSIVHVHHASLQQERQSYWYLIIITTVCTITIIGILCFSLRSCLYRKILPLFFYIQTSKPSYRTSSYPITILHTPPETNEATNIDHQKNVIFTTYSLQQAN